MSKLGNILENTKIMALTDKSGRTYHFLGQSEKEKHSAKAYYYLWLSRFFIFAAFVSLALLLAASLALFKLAPMVTVEPFLIINQNSSEDAVRYEPIARDMASKDKFMEIFVRQYIIYRNSYVNDSMEMRSRWQPGGIVHFLSSNKVFTEFNKTREEVENRNSEKNLNSEVEIISSQRVGGQNSPVWKVDFKIYEVSRSSGSTYLTLNTSFWTASVTAYFIPERLFLGRRLINPLGFTVTKYSQSRVHF
ncbi:MAG: type IV secretion system protein [Alphaproteobacteria bacterium]|nr:type IV secretion system protein [Alphaproteobacteria bacterium]